MRYRIQVGQDVFTVSDDDAASLVRHEMEQAARAGGAFVRLGPVGAPELLITPATHVRIDVLGEAELEHKAAGATDDSAIDADYVAEILRQGN